MSQELPAISEFEDLADLTQQEADNRHGNYDKRLRKRRSRRVAKKALAYAVGGSIAVFGGGHLLDRGLDQIDRNSNPGGVTLSTDKPSNERTDQPSQEVEVSTEVVID